VIAQHIYDTALALMLGAQADEETRAMFLPVLNLLLAENFALNNGLRTHRGMAALPSPPFVTSMGQRVEYEDIFTRVILPYGAAGLLYAEEDAGASVAYKNKYEYERAQLSRAEFVDIEDVYRGDCP
jgi:hypothetical protein